MRRLVVILVAVAVGAGAARAQTKVYVYPQKGQSKDQQAKDESECRNWATQESGVNPNAPQQPEQLGGNARGTVGGAARGAAVGAAVGAIAGDAGKGAGAGAVVGGVAGRRRSKVEKQAARADQDSNYLRAFAACMEGRGYTVK